MDDKVARYNKLKMAFNDFIAHARTIINQQPKNNASAKTYRLIVNREKELYELVTLLTRTSFFFNLVEIVETAFPSRGEYEEFMGSVKWYEWSESIVMPAALDEGERCEFEQRLCYFYQLDHLFRRSGFYNDVYEGREVDVEKLYNTLLKSFTTRKFNFTYLIPLKRIDFESANMKFGDYEIRKYSEEEIREITRPDINEVFYPECNLPVKCLKNYWYLVSEFSYTIEDDMDHFLFHSDHFLSKYKKNPSNTNNAFVTIALYPWPNEEISIFNIPFAIEINDNLTDWPLPLTIPDSMMSSIWGRRAADKEEINETDIHLDENDSRIFCDHLNNVLALIGNLRDSDENIKYIHVALEFFMKAWFTDGYDERFLWFITTIESLIGEKGGVTENTARRIALILGSSASERIQIRSEFKKIYNVRSEIIHGKKYPDDNLNDLIYQARSIARNLLMWHLHLVDYTKREMKDISGLNRKHIHRMIDYGGDESLPQDFPHVKEWLIYKAGG
jgi:hypothetical protein